MRYLATTLALVGLAAACSSSTDGDDDACRIEGTYTATAVQESGNCPIGGGESTGPVTDTVTKLPDGRYRLEIQGTTGACDLEIVEQCKLQGKCAIAVTDAINPGETGTVQYSWTFRRDGFDGFSAITVPPAQSLPGGCSATAKVTGTRR